MLELYESSRRIRGARGLPRAVLGPRGRRRRPLPGLRPLGGASPRRTPGPAGALPAAASRLPRARAAGAERVSTVGYELGEWERSWDDDGYAAAIEAVRAAIGRGDVYQANLVQHLAAPYAGDPWALALGLRHLHPLQPRPFVGHGWAVVSASPELFLARRGSRLVTSPIKGTRPAGVDVEGEKDGAEHVMIVDLERNDLARVCEPGSVTWPELMAQRELAGVTHLVSTVEGTIRARRRPRRDSRRHVPRWLGDRRPEDRRRRPDRRARAGRSRRLDGRSRHGLAPTATSSWR